MTYSVSMNTALSLRSKKPGLHMAQRPPVHLFTKAGLGASRQVEKRGHEGAICERAWRV